MLETKGHKASQPGLRGHSHDEKFDLMKRYVVAREMPSGGLLWLLSFDSRGDAIANVGTRTDLAVTYRVIDQFNGNAVIWRD